MNTTEKPRVYSYTRFSSPEQAKGDSERRQWEAAQVYAKEKGLAFDESLRLTDRGLSGFHGVHRKKGVFGAFLEKVKSGVVSPGSILVVENTDRLGREPMIDALQTIVFGLIKHGITIQMLCPRHTYTTASINDNDIWMLISDIKRANAESQRKSDLAQANWKQKRKLATEEKKVLTARAPAWLRLNGDGRFHVIPEAAETVELIFKLKLEGFGKYAIEKKLNQTALWRPENGWRASYIEKILRSRAVLGEYQPHKLIDGKRVPAADAIPDYFPRVIKPETWHAVHSRMASNKGRGGRTGKATNVFQNLVRCGYCGGSMVFIDKGDPPKGGKYLVCDNGRRGVELTREDEEGNHKYKCSAHSVRYEEFEETMLNNLRKLRPENVLPNADEQTKLAKALRDGLNALEGERNEIERKIENFIDQVGRTPEPSIRERYQKRILDLEARQEELDAEKANKETALHDLEKGAQSFEKWQANLAGLKKAIAKDVDSRIRLKAHLKEFITKVDVFGKGHEDNVRICNELIRESAPELAKVESYGAFLRHMRKRLLSADGRFYKLHLRTSRPQSESSKGQRHTSARNWAMRINGGGLKIAPDASLAYHGALVAEDGGWRSTGPKLDMLCKEFFDGRKPGFVPKASVL